MQPTPSKKAWFNTPLVFLPALASKNYDSYQSGSKSSYQRLLSNFPLLPPIFFPFKIWFASTWPVLRPYWQSSLIGSEKASHLLFTTCCRAEEENLAEVGVILEEDLDVKTNEMYFHFSFQNSNVDSSSSKEN